MSDRLHEVNHIGIAVASLEEAKRLYCDTLGFHCAQQKALPERGLKIAVLEAGTTTIELLEGIGETSTVAKFVRERGAGIHHLCFEVSGIDRVLTELAAAGIRLIDEKARPGAEGKPVAFLHPKSTMGVLIELIER